MADDPTPVATPAVAPSSTSTPGGSTTTTPTPLAGDEQEQISLDEARKLRREAAALRQRIKAYDDAQALADAAKLSETERLQKEYADLQANNEDLAAELMEARVNQDIARFAGKFNFILSFDLVSKLIEWKDIEWDEETGRPTNVEKLLERLAKASPDLVKPEPAPNQPQVRQAPSTPAMNPGRTQINPGGNVPGRRATLDDIVWKR